MSSLFPSFFPCRSLPAMATKEINNGRLAMIAVAGIVVQELVTGKTIF